MSDRSNGPVGSAWLRQARRFAALERAVLPLLLVLAPGCAGSTLGSGVGDALIERSPYYAGAGVLPGGSQRIGHLPVAFQRGASQPSIFDPTASDDLQALLDDMTRYLDAQCGVTARGGSGRGSGRGCSLINRPRNSCPLAS